MRILTVLFAACILMSPASGAAPAATAPGAWQSLRLLEREIAPGEKRKFSYQLSSTFEGSFLDTAVFVARGQRPGPALCVTALLHGDERNGFEIARSAFAQTDAATLAGTFIALPAANIHGFRTGSRYMPDRRDLNRAFPGNPAGSNTSLVASIIYSTLRAHCDALVDLHTGSFERANLPQIRADLGNPRAREFALAFGADIVLGGAGPDGSLRREMMDAGIPAIIYEAGLPLRFEPEEIARGVQGVRNVMLHLGMIRGATSPPTAASRVFSESSWQRVPLGQAGVYFPRKALGDTVKTGDIVAHIHDPFTDERHDLRASAGGTIVGMAVPQVVFSGYALLHIAN